METYITNEDKYLKLIQDELAREYHDEADKQMTTDFEEIEKSLQFRRLHILSFWTHNPKFRKYFHELWPFMNQHKLWNYVTPSQYKNGPGQYMLPLPMSTTFSLQLAPCVRCSKKLRPRAWQ